MGIESRRSLPMGETRRSENMKYQGEYPSKEELKIIYSWDFSKEPVKDLLDYVERLWWEPNWGFKLTGKRVLKLELHTGGWSGNESIIEALKYNFMFWSMYWQKSTRGGHYYFTINFPKTIVSKTKKEWAALPVCKKIIDVYNSKQEGK